MTLKEAHNLKSIFFFDLLVWGHPTENGYNVVEYIYQPSKYSYKKLIGRIFILWWR